MKKRMNKKLVFALALALVFVGSSFGLVGTANAACLSGCFPHISLPACWGNCSAVTPPLQSTCQGAYSFGPTTPNPMGAVGY